MIESRKIYTLLIAVVAMLNMGVAVAEQPTISARFSKDSIEVGDWVVIGGHTAVHQWVHIGDHAMIQGMSGVTKDVPPYITASNDGHYAGINKIGLSRRGFTHEQIMAIHDVCRVLFQSDLNYLNACDKAEAELPQSAERDYLISFVRSSERGCIKPYQKKAKAE